MSFSETEYSINEDDGPVQPVLLLSNPSSTDFAIQIRDNDRTASSKLNTLMVILRVCIYGDSVDIIIFVYRWF